MIPILLCTALTALAGPAEPQAAAPPIKVIATVPTYGELLREIGGDLVDPVVLCRPTQDMHSVAPTPSFMARVRGSDLLLYTGLDAELWLQDLLRGSANVHLLPGNVRAINLSDGIALKQVPVTVTRTLGDIHAFGNVHVWTDPLAVRGMAARIKDALIDVLPDHADEITERHADFHRRLTKALVGWLGEYRHLEGTPVVVYHRSWVYLLDRFGLESVGNVEPQPRMQPTASHLESLIEMMEARDVDIVVREPFHHPQATDFVQRATDVEVLELSTHPGFPDGVDGIIEHFEHNLAAIDAAVRRAEQRR